MYDINYINDFKKVIEDIVDARIKKNGITNYVSAKVINVNNDNTVDVIIPPDNTKYIKNLLNKTGETLKNGDSVELCTKNGKLSNAWVSVKHGKSNGGASGGWPIGSIYISVLEINPSTYFGGVWELYAKGKTIIGIDPESDTFNIAGVEGGSLTHKHTTGDFTLEIDNIPSHTHKWSQTSFSGAGGHSHSIGWDKDGGGGTNRYTVHDAGTSGAQGTSPTSYVGDHTHSVGGSNSSTGGGQPHNHGDTGEASSLSPYIVCYIWRRIS